MQNPKLLGALVIGVVAVAGVSWTVASRNGDETPPPPDSTQVHSSPQRALTPQDLMLDARSKGAPSAPITIYEASDFQCPYCRVFWEDILPDLEREYVQTGKARFIFLNLPLTQIHENAAAAHEFAMCAARQNGFWPVHDLLYRHQARWAGLEEPARYFIELGDSAQLARGELLECFSSGSVRWLVQAETEMNIRSGVRSTPSFIVEGALIRGAAPMDDWRPLLDSIYAEKTGAR